MGDEGHAGEPFLSHAEPTLHRCVAVSGPGCLVVGGCCGEVLGADVGQGVGRAQGRMSPGPGCVAVLRCLGYGAQSPHFGGPQLKVAVVTENNELVVPGAQRCARQHSVLAHRPTCLVQ